MVARAKKPGPPEAKTEAPTPMTDGNGHLAGGIVGSGAAQGAVLDATAGASSSQAPDFSAISGTTGIADEEIRESAYRLWEEDGRPAGDGADYWHKAREQLESRRHGDPALVQRDPMGRPGQDWQGQRDS